MSEDAGQRIEVRQEGDVTIVQFKDRKILDEKRIQEIGSDLIGLVETQQRKDLVLSFKDVDYLSSAALGKLITLRRKVNEVNGRLKLCCIAPETFKVFVVSRLDTFFDIHHDEQTALRSF